MYAVHSAIGTRCSGKGLYSKKEGRANEVAHSPVRFRRISFCTITLYGEIGGLKPEVSGSIHTHLRARISELRRGDRVYVPPWDVA